MSNSPKRVRADRAPRRGRPQKFGRPSQVVALTLPKEVVTTLVSRDRDIGWAIVDLVEKQHAGSRPPDGEAPVDLVQVGGGQSLIVVRSDVFNALPGIQMVPLSGARAFLALEPGRGMADLELAALDRLESPHVGDSERTALEFLRGCLKRWRVDRTLSFQVRSIIIVGQRHARPRSRQQRDREG